VRSRERRGSTRGPEQSSPASGTALHAWTGPAPALQAAAAEAEAATASQSSLPAQRAETGWRSIPGRAEEFLRAGPHADDSISLSSGPSFSVDA